MHILDLAMRDGLAPKAAGNDYLSACPLCGGHDPFIIWREQNCYYCTLCKRRGDPIQYLRDFHAMSYTESCKHLGILTNAPPHTQLWHPQVASHLWTKQASRSMRRYLKTLLSNPEALWQLYERGFTLATIKHFQIGLNPQLQFSLPAELAIPTLDMCSDQPLKLTIENIAISGSQDNLGIFGDPFNKPLIILESELNAMLIYQYAGDICCPIALGSASGRPDALCHDLLRAAQLLIIALNSTSAFHWWKKTYPNSILWAPPPEDKVGIHFRRWVLEGLRANGRKN